MTLQLTTELENQLTAAARANACTPEEIAAEAIQRFLAEEVEHQEVIDQRRGEISAGRVLDSDTAWGRLQGMFQR